VLKIDVEGLEAAVLRGGATVLANRPAVLCEVYSENRQEVATILGWHQYRFHDADDLQFKLVDLPTYNTLAVAAERAAIRYRRSALAV